jgi:nitroreductase
MAICSSKAIKVQGISYKKDLFDLPDHNINDENFVNFLANRRSVRNFKDKPVPRELLDKIVHSIAFAPNGSQPQKVNITVVNNRHLIETALPKLAQFTKNIVKWVENPLVRFIIKRKNNRETFNTLTNHFYPIAKSDNYNLEYGDRITRGAPAMIIFHAHMDAEEHTDNSLIYATYAMLTAHSLGLGATMISIVPRAINRMQELKEIFEIPEEHEAVISVIIGYPKYKYKRAIIRDVQQLNWIE